MPIEKVPGAPLPLTKMTRAELPSNSLLTAAKTNNLLLQEVTQTSAPLWLLGGFSPHPAIPPAVTTPKKYVVLHNTVCPENQQVRALILGQGGLLCSCVFLAVS